MGGIYLLEQVDIEGAHGHLFSYGNRAMRIRP